MSSRDGGFCFQVLVVVWQRLEALCIHTLRNKLELQGINFLQTQMFERLFYAMLRRFVS